MGWWEEFHPSVLHFGSRPSGANKLLIFPLPPTLFGDGLKFWRALSRGGEVPTILGGKAVLWQRLPEFFEYELHREQSQVPPTKKKLRGLLSSDFHFGVLVVTSQNCSVEFEMTTAWCPMAPQMTLHRVATRRRTLRVAHQMAQAAS